MSDARLDKVRAEMDAAIRRIEREYIAHVYACPDPVACEIRAWQAVFDETRKGGES